MEIDPILRRAVDFIIAECAKKGITARMVSGARDPWTQARLYRRSRSTTDVLAYAQRMAIAGAPWCAGVLLSVGPQPTGPWATNAAPGESWHQHGRAADILIYRDGELVERGDDPAYTTMGEIAEALGLTWGGRWSTPDCPHVQLDAASSPRSAGMGGHAIDEAMERMWAGRRTSV